MNNNISNTYKYFIDFGQNIKDTKKVVPALTIAQPNKQKVDVDQKIRIDSFNVSLDSIQINRKIYQPCEIKVELTFEPSSEEKIFPTPKQLSDMLLQRKVDMGILKDPKAAPEAKNIDMIAQNYYVHEIYPQLSRSAVLKVKLAIYSMDKLMTLDKYSKAFTSKKLSNIVKDETCIFGYTDRFLEAETNLQNLVYKDDKETKNEFIHPYLVQYNETFYDFLVRTTNRCGEFLYFEDGKLQVGLKTQKEEAIDIEDYANVTFQNESAGPLDIADYTRDSMKEFKDGKDLTEESDLNFDAINPNGAGYPDDAFTTKLSYNSEVATDDYFYYLYKDKFQTYLHAMGWSDSDGLISYAIGLTKQAISNTDGGWLGMAEVVKDMSLNLLLSTKDALLAKRDDNNGGNENYIDKYKDKDNGDGTKTALFANVLKECWTTVNYYKDIRCKEEEMKRQTICIDMGTNYVSVKLGDKIKIAKMEGTYVVIQVKQLSQQKWINTYDKYDDDSIAQDNYSGQQSQKIYAIPVSTDASGNVTASMPPLAGVSPIRKSGPQTAFVVDNNDAKQQARVRIAFPWQNIASTEKVKLAAAAGDEKKIDILINKMQQDIEADRKRRETSSALLRYLYKSDSDQTDSLTKLEDELARIKARKAEIEKFLNAEETYKELTEIDTKKKEGDISSKGDLKIALNQNKDEQKALERVINSLKAIPNLNKKQEADIRKKEIELSALKKAAATLEAEIDMIPIKITSYTAEKNELEERIKAMESVYKKLETEKNKITDKYKNAIAAASGEKKANLEKELADEWNEAEKQAVEELRKDLLDSVEKMDKAIIKKENDRQAKEKEAAKCADKKIEKANLMKDALKKDASPWVRVATPMATQGGGFYFAPAPGDEVLVNFDNNNVERPFVVGSLYSKNLTNPQGMTIMSPNGHTMTFDNPSNGTKFVESLVPAIGIWKNSCGLAFFGAPDFGGFEDAGKAYKDATKPLKDFTGGIHFTDRYGFYDVEMCSHKRKVSISSPLGKVSIDAFQGITVSAPNGDVKIEGKNVTIKAGNNLTLESGGNVREKAKIGEAAQNLAQSVVSDVISEVVGNVASVVDLDLLRSVLEVITRPVEGTTLIKSKRYLKLEAGRGKAMIQRDRYKIGHRMKHENEEMFAYAMQNSIKAVDDAFTRFYEEYATLKSNAILAQTEFLSITNLIVNNNKKDTLPDVKTIAYTFDLKKEWVADGKQPDASIKLEEYSKEGTYDNSNHAFLRDKIWINFSAVNDKDKDKDKKLKEELERRSKFLHQTALTYGAAIVALRKHIAKLNDENVGLNSILTANTTKNHEDYVNTIKRDAEVSYKKKNPLATKADTEFFVNTQTRGIADDYYPGNYIDIKAKDLLDEMITSDDGILKKWKDKYGDAAPTDDFLMPEADPTVDPLFADDEHPQNRKFFKRMFAVKLMKEAANNEEGKNYIKLEFLKGKNNADIEGICKDDGKWEDFLDNMNRKDNALQRSLYDIFVEAGKEAFSKNISNILTWRWKDAEHWDDSKGGQILFSDSKGKTIRMEGEQLKVDNDSHKYSDSYYKSVIKDLK